MSEIWVLWLIFLGMNILDGFTTYLNLYRLPPELRAEEMNPIFNKLGIEKRFKRSMFLKAFIVFASFIFVLVPYPYLFKILILVFIFVVLNNSYIYLGRRIMKKKIWTLGNFLKNGLVRIKIPERFAGGLAFLVLMVSLVWTSAGILTLIGG